MYNNVLVRFFHGSPCLPLCPQLTLPQSVSAPHLLPRPLSPQVPPFSHQPRPIYSVPTKISQFNNICYTNL